MVPTWTFSPNGESSNGENWRPSKHQYNFPSLKCGSAISSSVNHSLTTFHLCRNLLSQCSYSFSSHAVFSLAFCLFVSLLDCETESKEYFYFTLVLPAKNSLPWPYFKTQARYHLSRKPVLTHLIWINPPPLCFLLPYANFYLCVHHVMLLSPVYLFLHWDAELLEVRNCISKCSAKGQVHRRISIMAYWKIFS